MSEEILKEEEKVDDVPETTEEETFTQDQLDDILSKRLARERAKYESELREKIAKEKEEAKRLAELSAEERAKEESRLKDEELADAKAKLRRYELEKDTVDRLNEEGIDLAFKEFLIGTDEESTNENIKSFKDTFNTILEKEISKKLASTTPSRAAQSGGGNNPFKTETLNLTEQGRLLRENPELAKTLMAEAGL